MADKKITDLPEIPAVADGDYLEIVDVSAGTSNKITVNNLLSPVTDIGTFQSYLPVWTAYTGTPSLGNGTLTGRYCKVGKMVIVNMSLTFGSTTSVAGTETWYISLPITSAGLGHGVWVAFESGVKFHTGILHVMTGDTKIVAFFMPDGQGYFSETRPHTWKANDYLRFTAIYEIA